MYICSCASFYMSFFFRLYLLYVTLFCVLKRVSFKVTYVLSDSSFFYSICIASHIVEDEKVNGIHLVDGKILEHTTTFLKFNLQKKKKLLKTIVIKFKYKIFLCFVS